MEHISGDSAAELYREGIWCLRINGIKEDSRNGEVLTVPHPVLLTHHKPWRRVLTDPIRRPNPYFHLAEFVWMMAGSHDATWIAKYNKRMLEYADDGVHNYGAYGYRWRQHFSVDQIINVVNMLTRDPTTRRAVLGMWDPTVDMLPVKDLPCNTHIYFRVHDGALNMTVCNRSNDFFWGMLGANIVHMTMLHELIALASGHNIGVYRVFCNNLHAYTSVPNYKKMMESLDSPDVYRNLGAGAPLLCKNELVTDFIYDAQDFVYRADRFDLTYKTQWFNKTFVWMMLAYEQRLAKEDETDTLNTVESLDWMAAGFAWKHWKES